MSEQHFLVEFVIFFGWSGSPSLNPVSIPVSLSQSNLSSSNEIQRKVLRCHYIQYQLVNLGDFPNIIMPSDTTKISSERVITQTEIIARHLVEKLSDLLVESFTSTQNTTTSTLLPALLNEDVQQRKELLFRLLLDSFPFKTSVDVSTQVMNRIIIDDFIFVSLS